MGANAEVLYLIFCRVWLRGLSFVFVFFDCVQQGARLSPLASRIYSFGFSVARQT